MERSLEWAVGDWKGWEKTGVDGRREEVAGDEREQEIVKRREEMGGDGIGRDGSVKEGRG